MYFKKLITIIIGGFVVFAITICLISCGHSVTHTDRGAGLVIRIPLFDGSSLIDLKIGKIDSTTTVLRNRTAYDSIATMGTSNKIQINTITPASTTSGSDVFLVEPEMITVVGSEIVEVVPDDKIIGVGGRIVLFSSAIVILFIIASVVVVSIISNSNNNKLASKKKVEKFNKKFENY